MISSSQLKELQEPTIALARMAGERILSVYETAFEVTRKEDKSPLTEADMAAHGVITVGLEKLTPSMPMLSEEGPILDYEVRRRWRTYWLIDPLDGTREFVKRNGEFSVNIALIDDYRPVLGVVYAPVLQELYFASHGAGAYKQCKGGEPQAIRVNETARQPFRVTGSRSHSTGRLGMYLERLGAHELISLGSSLKACLVAEGKADLYPRFGPTSEWDTAAAQCVVEEAGGLITSMDMQPLRYNTKESLLNPHFFVFGDRSRNWSGYL
ncbi:MAG TPA: 3'(2'),5'-bisphosphate nucleotidase CysQ [Gammaproteobacteria bacterium]